MPMSRTVFAIMAGLFCALAGVKHAASLKGDADRLSRWVQLLTHLSLLLKEGTLSIPEALCTAATNLQLPDRLMQDMAARIQGNPLLSLADAYRQCSEACMEHELLTRLFTRLGHGTKENRILAVEQSIAEMRLLASFAAGKAMKDARLWQTLGFTGGICLTILLL